MKQPFSTRITNASKKALEHTHPSANRLFSQGNKLESIVKKGSQMLRKSHLNTYKAIKNNNHSTSAKIGEYILANTYSAINEILRLGIIGGYTGLNLVSRVSETATRTTLKTLNIPGKIIKKKKPNSWLGKFHQYSTEKLNKTKNLFNSKKIFQIPKDLAVIGLSLVNIYTIATTDFNNVQENILETIENFNPFSKNESFRNTDYEIGILVGGSEDPLKNNDLLNVDIDFKDKEIRKDSITTYTAKYYLINSEKEIPTTNTTRFKKNLIPIGERNFKANEGISGMFVYEPNLKNTYDKESPGINPFANENYNNKSFEFLVIIYKGNKKITHKFWGEDFKKNILENKIKQDNLSFKFIRSTTKKNEETKQATVIDKKDIRTYKDKKIFLYQQKFSNKTKNNIFNTADYVMPHYWDVKKERQNNTPHIKKRLSKKSMKEYVAQAHTKKVKVIPMFSAFKKTYINNILNNPQLYAKEIINKVSNINADGITIDLESIAMGKEKSEKLVFFMTNLKNEFNKLGGKTGKKYEVAIATSPRFQGGYAHHEFYNYGKLDTIANVDWIHMMGYDFNVKEEGAGLPKDKLKKIINYAITNTKNNDKLVLCMPLYGRVFNKKGKTVGVLSEKNNHSYLHKKGAIIKEKNGELLVYTKNPIRHAYLQTPKIQKKRLNMIDSYQGKIHNIGGWRVSNATTNTLKEFQKWKQRSYNK